MNNIIDSSAWIEFFKGNKNYIFIKELILNNSIGTNDIILTELLPQILHKKEKKLAGLLNSLKKYALAIDWQEARNIQLLNIKNGNNNIGISDILIAQNCIQNNLKLITHDKHFRLMAKCIPLQVRYADP